ncbi:MAG: dihydropteroate synthase [Anaerosomatales bacterium]|nr:dihydropteroate synthase [Anaerosomatales bacterium]MDT8434286.1 dihydropteroate synthase [Anaerosomatales bacterium]
MWSCGDRVIELDAPLVMGILNVTPDSFSDGGEHTDAPSAVDHARAMLSGGAHIIDVGGESTRPGSAGVSEAAELGRVLPVVEQLAAAADPPLISIDTRRAGVARACVDAGASIINDVTGFRDPAMIGVAAGCDAGLVVMHMLGSDFATMQDDPRYDDVVAEVTAFLGERAGALEAVGVDPKRIAVDPGIGFGKTLEHNLELLRRLHEIAALGYPVLVGASRKRFIGHILDEEDPKRRVAGSVGAAAFAVINGADIVRVHDVAETAQAFRVIAAIGR